MAVVTADDREKGRAPLPLTSRRDWWWVRPLVTVLVLGGFVIYSGVRAFVYADYHVGPYLSPFYAPFIPIDWNLFGYLVSPAFYILIFPLSFRLTCYYYRQAYYRAFFWDPPACAVREPLARKKYEGERRFPFILQNLHRFSLYAALVFIVILSYDAILAFFFEDGFHVNVGSVIFVVNVVFISLYTFSCHSWRHLIGGGVDCYSCDAMTKTRHGLWKRFTFLNEQHAWYAWISLFSVALTDFYVWMVASGTITDFRII
ncbi:MAG: succinate dehydrogenase [Chloroflexia bacterium]